MAGPLGGIRVVDLSQVVSGPWATMLLADQGAEVIKVEPRVGGEVLRPLRNFGRNGINSLIANNNRGKLGFAVDLGSQRGVETLKRVIATADVFARMMRRAEDREISGWNELQKLLYARGKPRKRRATPTFFDPMA